MKLSTILPLAGGLAAGYILGTAAGRGRYQQIKSAANGVWRHPKVQETVFNVAGQAKSNAERLPGPAAGLVDTAAAKVQENLTHPENGDRESSGSDAPGSQIPRMRRG